MNQIFFTDWDGILRTLITTVIAYIVVVFMLRVSGKRTLSKMNAFDTVVTIALGSILGSVILSKSTPIAEGLLAIALLITLQYIITFISVRSSTFKKMISSNPTLLFYDGSMLKDAQKKQRVSTEEINSAVREAGFASYDNIKAIVMESTGDITVISNSESENTKTLEAFNDFKNFY